MHMEVHALCIGRWVAWHGSTLHAFWKKVTATGEQARPLVEQLMSYFEPAEPAVFESPLSNGEHRLRGDALPSVLRQ